MKNLTLNVKKKWFDMILSGEKKEEYRTITQRRTKQLLHHYDTVTFLNGMKTLTPKIVVKCEGIKVGFAKPEWSDNWQGEVFVISLGEIIETKNIK